MNRPPPGSPLFPYTTLFRSRFSRRAAASADSAGSRLGRMEPCVFKRLRSYSLSHRKSRSEEHTSELQSLRHLVCRLLLEKKKHTFLTSSNQQHPPCVSRRYR